MNLTANLVISIEQRQRNDAPWQYANHAFTPVKWKQAMKVREWRLRVLTSSTDPEVEARIRRMFETILHGYAYHFSPMQQYWKYEGWGEFWVDMQGVDDIDAIKSQLAVQWKGEVAERQWTKFCDDAINFLWLTGQ